MADTMGMSRGKAKLKATGNCGTSDQFSDLTSQKPVSSNAARSIPAVHVTP